MKKLLFLIFGIFISTSAFSQYNFRRYSIGIGGGMNEPYSDVKVNHRSPAFTLNGDFYLTPFIIGGLESQFGTLRGGSQFDDKHLRQFENSYVTTTVNTKFALGELLNYHRRSFLNSIKGLYIGSGVGFIKNKMTFVTRIKPDGSNYEFPGKDASINLVVPLHAGINFNFLDAWDETRYIMTLGYQMNVTFGEGMDGFNDPPKKFENDNNDMFAFATIGVKYCFGRQAPFYRPFRY
ncbi:MAG: hypothetical protein ABI390_08310 [Daejeonella sp.]